MKCKSNSLSILMIEMAILLYILQQKETIKRFCKFWLGRVPKQALIYRPKTNQVKLIRKYNTCQLSKNRNRGKDSNISKKKERKRK